MPCASCGQRRAANGRRVNIEKSNAKVILERAQHNEKNLQKVTRINLNPKKWGSAIWDAMHITSFGYPNNPTESEMDSYMKYYELIGKTLPCETCRASYDRIIVSGPLALTKDIMKNRTTLTTWVMNVRNKVSTETKSGYMIQYKQLLRKYSTYI